MGTPLELLRRYRAEIVLGIAVCIISSASFALGWHYRDRTAAPTIVLEQCSDIGRMSEAGEGGAQER
jgi:hypothetical protein